MGRLAMGRRALGLSSGFAVKVGNELPGPHKIKACRPGVAMVTAWGIAKVGGVGEVKLLGLLRRTAPL